MLRTSLATLLLLSGALFNMSALEAQDPVPRLTDLVGARASSGESQMESRGYRFVRTEKSDTSSYSYWREARTQRCVTVRTAEGRYASIVYAPDLDCLAGGAASQLPAVQDDDNFDTVCGVETGGKVYRYRCRLKNEGCKGEGYCRTIVTYPDNEFRLVWQKNDEVVVEVSGLDSERTTSSFDKGQTRWDFSGQTYFVYRTPERAKRELAKLPK